MESVSGLKTAFGEKHGYLLPVLVFAVLLVFFIYGISKVGSGTVSRQKESLERALTKSITECYAEEGHYPPDLSWLMEHYDLHFNEERFFVDYRIRGTDLRPEFTIIERKEGQG